MESEQLEQHPEKWSKLERIRYLLDHWSDIWQPNVASSLSGQRGGGSEAIGLPEMARTRSVVELNHCLSALAIDHPIEFAHLKSYRCNAEWRQVRAMVRVQLTSGRWDEIPGWKKERIVPSWVELARVNFAEDWLQRHFEGDVFLPMELWDGLVKAV